MMRFFRLLHADHIKLRHSPLKWMHLVIPVICIAVFLSYFSYSKLSSISAVCMYLQTIASVFPLIIGVVCSMCIEQEESAGKFKELLSGSNPKVITIFSKYVIMVLLGLGALTIAVMGFDCGFYSFLHKNSFKVTFYITAVLILLGSSLFEYIFHIFLSMRIGNNASIGIGILETLISVIFMTSLGEKIWIGVPCAWGTRFINMWTLSAAKVSFTSKAVKQLHSGMEICIFVTAISILLASAWFNYWEGKRMQD